MRLAIPEVVVLRLPEYLRALEQLAGEGVYLVSSQELGEKLQVTPAQIRKDLSYFGHFGKQGKGYDVKRLIGELRRILGLDRDWRLAVVGVGNLGRALLRYGGFSQQGFKIVAAFDTNPKVTGKKVGPVVVQDVAEMPKVVKSEGVHIGVVSVPASAAQEAVDRLVQAGVRAILNYAPATLRVPPSVYIRHVGPVSALESMTFYLKDVKG
ncbi:MAG: redox-sensing transcriptional repressor Rex [Chloroflexi bacterium]|nr:redox-sensing transcriptional repressor Rex [Chloroflexota bacterium]